MFLPHLGPASSLQIEISTLLHVHDLWHPVDLTPFMHLAMLYDGQPTAQYMDPAGPSYIVLHTFPTLHHALCLLNLTVMLHSFLTYCSPLSSYPCHLQFPHTRWDMGHWGFSWSHLGLWRNLCSLARWPATSLSFVLTSHLELLEYIYVLADVEFE